MLLCGYEFRNMNKKEVYKYLEDKNIYYDNDSNIYEDSGCMMYQVCPKVYDNEIDIIETQIDKDVYLITHVYKFIHNQKKKE